MVERLTVQGHVAQRHGAELAEVFGAIVSAALQIEAKIRTAGLADILGAFGQTNVQGEQQQKLDVFANDAMIEAMRATKSVAAIVSEEDDEPVIFTGKGDAAKLIAIFDPLDGSSNIDVNVNTGTIVSIVRADGRDAKSAALQAGTKQVAGLYVVYGPSTLLVYTAGDGVYGFTLDPKSGEFLLSWERMRMPEQGTYYSVNEANVGDFPTAYGKYLAGLRDGSLLGQRYSLRYIGSLVADFHRTLLKGGVFLYPPTAKAPKGKLRLLYEANPIAFLTEQAGGLATDGSGRILEIEAEQPHQRTTLIVGGRREVEALMTTVAVGA